jgi:APA family basic amino acid/polyamine antiporter
MAREHALWKPLRKRSAAQIPVRALWLHVAIAVALTLTGTFEQIVIYAGFVLQLNVTLVVASVLFLKKRPSTFQSPFYPYAQYLFIAFSVWILGYTLYDRPTESLIGLGIIGVGLVTYFFSRREEKAEM